MDIIGKDVNSLVFMLDGKEYPVEQLTNNTQLKTGIYYLCGEYLYRYIGECHITELRRQHGVIGIVGTRTMVNGYDNAPDDIKEKYHMNNVYLKEDLENNDINSILTSYMNNYKMNKNLVIANHRKVVNTGELFIPDLNEKDDALTRLMKLMIRHLKINRREYKSNFDKDYSFDNLVSALNGATVNMSITKFLTWCDLLQLNWKFELDDNGDDPEHPVGHIEISNEHSATVDYGEEIPGVFRVPLKDNDDPLKRLIKICVIKKKMVLSEYRDKGSTPHLINNMRSALKRDGRMMFPYFTYWCEILGMNYLITLEKDGYVETSETCFQIPIERINDVELSNEEDRTSW